MGVFVVGAGALLCTDAFGFTSRDGIKLQGVSHLRTMTVEGLMLALGEVWCRVLPTFNSHGSPLELRNLLGLLGAVQLYFGLVLGQLPFILGVPRHEHRKRIVTGPWLNTHLPVFVGTVVVGCYTVYQEPPGCSGDVSVMYSPYSFLSSTSPNNKIGS